MVPNIYRAAHKYPHFCKGCGGFYLGQALKVYCAPECRKKHNPVKTNEARLEAALNGDPNASLIIGIGAVPYLLEAIREQQAALQATQTEHPDKYRPMCREVLERWRIE